MSGCVVYVVFFFLGEPEIFSRIFLPASSCMSSIFIVLTQASCRRSVMDRMVRGDAECEDLQRPHRGTKLTGGGYPRDQRMYGVYKCIYI